MKLTANGTCEPCSDLNSDMFTLPPALQKAKPVIKKAKDDMKGAANRVAAPATPIMTVVLVGGVTAGVIAGLALAWSKFRKDR